MGFSGNLASISLADIFQNLATNSQTGTLGVVRDGAKRWVRFEGGMVADFCREHEGQGLPPIIGYMVGRCLLTGDQAEYALRRCADGGGNVVQACAELGYCSVQDAAAAVARYVEEEVYDLFTLDNGEFEFTDGDAPDGVFRPEGRAAGVKLSTGSLVMEAARRIDEWGRIRKTLPRGREVLICLDAGDGRASQTDPAGRRLLELADGTRDIDDLVADSHMSRYEVGMMLCAFMEDGIVRSADTEDLENAAAELVRNRRPERAVKILERLLALGRDSIEVRRRLVDAAVQAGESGRAVIHLAVLADGELEAGRESKAAEIWGRMLELMPTNTRALQGLAEHWRRRGDEKKSAPFYLELARSHLSLGTADRAAAAARIGLEMCPKSEDFMSVLAESLAAAGKKAEACEQYETLGDMLVADHRNRAAADAYRKALQLDPGLKRAKAQLADILAVEARARHAAGRRMVVLTLLAVVGGLLALLGGYEFLLVRPRFVRAESFAKQKIEEGEQHLRKKDKEYDEAIACYREAASALAPVESLISLHRYEVQASRMRNECEQRILRIGADKEQKARDLALQAETINREVDGLVARGDLAAARAKLDELLRLGTEKDKAAAKVRIADIQACMDEIGEVLGRVGSFLSEEEEFRTLMGLAKKYPSHPDVCVLTVPVRVETDPPGAQVSVGTGPATPAPCTVRLPVGGETQVTFRRKGYKESTVSVSPVSPSVRETRAIVYRLERVPDWKIRVGAPVEAPIVLAGGIAVVGDRSGTIWAIDAREGKEVWKKELGQFSQVTAGVAVAEGTVYTATLDRRLHALDIATGEERWPAFEGGGLIRSAPRVARVQLLNNQRFVFFGSDDGAVYCVNAEDGKLRWKSRTNGAIQGSVLVTDEAVYAAGEDEYLRALALTNGEEIWSVKLGGAIHSTPVLANDGKSILVGADDGVLYAVNPTSHGVRWRRKSSGSLVAGPVQWGTRVFVGSSDGTLIALRMSEDAVEPLWEQRLGGKITACPLICALPGAQAVGQARLYVGAYDGLFYALDVGRDGMPAWTYKTGAGVRSGAAWFEGLVLVGSDDGFVYAFDER